MENANNELKSVQKNDVEIDYGGVQEDALQEKWVSNEDKITKNSVDFSC